MSERERHPRASGASGADQDLAQTLPEFRDIHRLLVDSVSDYAIFVLDPQGCIQTWNAGAERLKGYRAEEILGQHLSRFYTAEDQRDVIASEGVQS